MKRKKLNRMHDILLNLYKQKDIPALAKAKLDYPNYALKAQCYIDRLVRRSANG